MIHGNVKYCTTSEVAKWVYENVGKIVRNLDGVVCIDGVPATRRDVCNIYNSMKQRKLPIVMSRVEDVIMEPRWFDFRQGPHIRFPETGWLNNEKYTRQYMYGNYAIYKVHRTPRNEFAVREIHGEILNTTYFALRSETIQYFNEISGAGITNF